MGLFPEETGEGGASSTRSPAARTLAQRHKLVQGFFFAYCPLTEIFSKGSLGFRGVRFPASSNSFCLFLF